MCARTNRGLKLVRWPLGRGRVNDVSTSMVEVTSQQVVFPRRHGGIESYARGLSTPQRA